MTVAEDVNEGFLLYDHYQLSDIEPRGSNPRLANIRPRDAAHPAPGPDSRNHHNRDSVVANQTAP